MARKGKERNQFKLQGLLNAGWEVVQVIRQRGEKVVRKVVLTRNNLKTTIEVGLRVISKMIGGKFQENGNKPQGRRRRHWSGSVAIC